MSKDERESILEKSRMLEKIQNEEESPQNLATIPHLSRSDLSVEIDIIQRRHEDLQGVPAICHELYTNGITYTDLAFPVDVLSFEDYLWLPFFSRVVVSVGLPGMDYGEVSSLLARTAGGFVALLHTGSIPDNAEKFLDTASGKFDLAGRDWLFFRLKCLDEKLAASLDLVLRLICEADFSDLRRINDLVLEMKNEIDSSLAPMGHIYASGRAGRLNSSARKIEETWNGLSQIDFVHRLVKLETSEVVKKLEQLREKITGSGLIVNITGCVLDTARAEIAKRFSRFGAPVNRVNFKENPAPAKQTVEVFASQSLQVGFAALSMNAAPFDTIEQLAETVLTHQLSTGALWENIRMKGGAYGAFINSDVLEKCVSFATYRDPNPLGSLNAVSAILKNGSYGNCTEDYLVKSIIGCYAKETRPRTSAENGYIDLFRFLYGIDDSYRKRKLERLVSVSTADIAAVFASLGTRPATGKVVIAGVKKAEQAAKALGTEARLLP